MAVAQRNINWPAQQVVANAVTLTTSSFGEDDEAVVSTTASASAGNILINGTLSNTPTVPTAANLGDKTVLASNVSVLSTDNISGATFTISGFYLGLPQTDFVTGVNNNTVYTNLLFTTVTNVSVDMTVTNFSLGKGGPSNSNQTASLVIDGTYSNYLTQLGPYVATFKDMIRTVSFSSNDDLTSSGITLTIIGTYLGNVVQDQTITSGNLPNNSMVQTTQIFDSVTQVIVSGGTPTNFSIGLGFYGMLQFVNYDFKESISALAVQVIVGGTINYSFGGTLQNVSNLAVANPAAYFGVSPPVNPPATLPTPNQLYLFDATASSSMTNLAVDSMASVTTLPLRYYTILIANQSGGEDPNTIDESGSLQVYFIQGGI